MTTDNDNTEINKVTKMPYPIRFYETDWVIVMKVRERLSGIPSLTKIIRAAASLGLKQMENMSTEELLNALKGAK